MEDSMDLALPETVAQKVAKRDEQAKIMLQIIELAKKLNTVTYELAEKLRYPQYIKERDIDDLRKKMDYNYWHQCLDELQVEKYLTTKDKETLFEKFQEKCPVFNEVNVNEALYGFMNSKEATATEMIKKIYHQVTDLTFRVGNKYRAPSEKRIQLDIPLSFRASMFYVHSGGLPSYVSSSNSRFELIEDLERACFLCDGKTQPDRMKNIRAKTDETLRAHSDLVHGDYFTLKIFKNGNIKIDFTNSEVLKTLNRWGKTGKYLGGV